ncbi:hypothetical protein MIV038R [Invertebrate iridescent virus 3]|uniref:Uncharacterized protein 038R n=1 Tax=Invertebrate iridescent virus 3 TaxID=345201 RepID=VF098_IIV3|nr:hypothetical protein MIV038R [Invertebrate iridescent virus 3]Q197C2.1 RecName: Full=Uncharacterized protein 038R [Invertebrate iridescent virus 3]ABF82068.1 hypothetical protein MIV038R [Invertebrate iridescent virus 3]
MDLQYYKIFKQKTSQGMVGLLRPLKKRGSENVFKLRLNHKSTPSATDYFFVQDEPAFPIFVFKIPKEVNYLLDHEFEVSKNMKQLTTYLPHFNTILEIKRDVKCHVPEKLCPQALDDPFAKYNCTRDVAIVEYIPSKTTLLEYILGTNFTRCTDSLIHQLILALFIAQQQVQFSHYDLHLENVLIRRCFKRTFFWYKFSYEHATFQRLILTNGLFPVIFDYGFAHSTNVEGSSYYNSLFFTNKGYTPMVFDDVVDFKTLLIRMAHLYHCPQKFKTLVASNFLKNPQLPYKVDRETGWIKSSDKSIARIVCTQMEEVLKDHLGAEYESNFIYKELEQIIDLFMVLIKLPLVETEFNVKELEYHVGTFVDEWGKIDAWFSHGFTDDKLNILKKIFTLVNELILEQSERSTKTTRQLVKRFQLAVYEILDQFGEFVHVQQLDYGSLFHSIVQLSEFIEHVAYKELTRHQTDYPSGGVTGWSLFTQIEQCTSSVEPYLFRLDDHIVLFDCIDQATSFFELKDVDIVESLNQCGTISNQIRLLDSLDLVDH